MGRKIKNGNFEAFISSVFYNYGEPPKRSGVYLAATLTNIHRVFYCKYNAGKGWALKDKGRNVYAWAELPEFPPVPEGVILKK